MPGFKITGNETINADPGAVWNSEIRRVHRWVFTAINKKLPDEVRILLKTASRPSFTFDEQDLHHNQEQIWYAGKQRWEPITFTFYDAEQPSNTSSSIWEWLKLVCDISKVTLGPPGSYKSENAILQMVKGDGTKNEEWKIWGGWPQSTNWNALDYTQSELATIEVKYRYDRAERTF